MNSIIQKLNSLGQSIWFDNIQRRLLEKRYNGEGSVMAGMIDRGEIRGVTSNPSIFNNAIAKTKDYDSALTPLAWSGMKAEQIFWQLAIEDIREACDLFSKLYQETAFLDGYVSLEVSPKLAHNAEETLNQVKHLWKAVDRPNLMVKIPATHEGLPAIQAAITAGININVTLIFSIERYRAVMEAYLSGLETRLADGNPVDHVASVASFFVSRIDTKVDSLLSEKSPLRGKTAIAYAKLAYEEFVKIFSGDRFTRMKALGCQVQRPLWASTSTKNPAYADTLYMDNLIGSNTVNTVPPQTLEAFCDHGQALTTLGKNIEQASNVITGLEKLGISMNKVTEELEDEGVKSFEEAFNSLLKTIDERRLFALKSLGSLDILVEKCISNLVTEDVPERIWALDPSLWTTSEAGQEEIKKRLGWLNLPKNSRTELQEICEFISEIKTEGFTHFLLFGMGGSSLAPEVLSLMFTKNFEKGTVFSILDSTDPNQVLAADKDNPPEKTLYIMSSKSGETAEIKAMFNYFWERSGQKGSHFASITDPGTNLETFSKTHGFRKTFLANPNVGGRYSVLTAFGLVPAALMGIDLSLLLDRAEWMMDQCGSEKTAERNPGFVLGAIIGQAALAGRDKLTIIADELLTPFASWLEQLVAESSGKMGRGIIPVVGEEIISPESYGDDRIFVYFRQDGKHDSFIEELLIAGTPAMIFNISSNYDLGAEFYRWEMAIAIACAVINVNAFDQPDVQDSKDRTNTLINAYRKYHLFEEDRPHREKEGIGLFSTLDLIGTTLGDNLHAFLGNAKKGDYVAINAFLPRNPNNEMVVAKLRKIIQTRTGCATTAGFGPRFLHSTGQLHKGGPNSGLFLQITAQAPVDLEIPGQEISFGTLERAQALGDYQALASRGRRIIRINLPSIEVFNYLVKAME